MKIVVDNNYCVIRIECEDQTKETTMTINIKNEMSLTNDERKEVEA